MFSNCSHSGFLRMQLIILYEKCLRRESECPAAIHCCRQCKNIVIWDLLTNISRKKSRKSKNRHWQPCQRVLGLTVSLSKPRSKNVAILGRRCSGWCWIKNEWRRWTARAGGGAVGGNGGWKKPSEQTALLVRACLFRVTALTDTTGPGGCLQDKMLLSFKGGDWQFCMALDNFLPHSWWNSARLRCALK